MGFGGPVWHVSIGGPIKNKDRFKKLALEALQGVGDESQEWHEWTGVCYHIRRRLNADEQKIIGPAIDCRRSGEGRERFERIKDTLHPRARLMALEELETV